MASIKCTHCGAALKLASTPAPGKKIKCPKCGKAFAVPEDEDEPEAEAEEAAEEQGEEEEEAAPKTKKPAKPAADEDDAEDEAPKKKEKKNAKDKKKNGDARDADAEPKKKSSTGLILGLIGGGVGLLLLCCCGGGGACLMTGEGLKDGKFGVDRNTGEKPMVTTNAENLAKELIADDAAFKKKYSPRRVEVTAEVLDVHPTHFTLLGAKKDQKDQFGVNPSIALKDKDKALRLGKGQKVKVTGLCHSQMVSSIQIYDAEVTLDGPKTLIEISAADLAKDYETNANAADGKYKDKDVLVTGPISQLEFVKGTSARLKGTAKTEVAFFLAGEADKYRDLKVGQQVELRGRLQIYYKDQNSIGVQNAMRVPAK